jgi:hypothetical protein
MIKLTDALMILLVKLSMLIFSRLVNDGTLVFRIVNKPAGTLLALLSFLRLNKSKFYIFN